MIGESPGGTPALLRLEAAAALRRHRKAARLTTAAVKNALGFSYSKLSRIETGNRSIQLKDLEALCDLYGIAQDERQRLIALVEGSRETSQWQELDTFERETAEYAELEQVAYRIDEYKTSTVTSTLQTPAYARAFYRAMNPHLTDDALESRLETREFRRSALLARHPLPVLNFVLDEAALRRLVGGVSVMQEQVTRLIELAEIPRVTIQVLPFAAGAHRGMDSLFTILSFREAVRDRVYVDGLAPAQYLVDEKELERYREAFDFLTRQALSPAATIDYLRAIREELGTG